MNYDLLNNNRASLTGVIETEPAFSHEVFGENFYETFIRVNRLSEQTDLLPMTISEHLIRDYDIKRGDTVSLLGQFRSYNKIEGDKSKLMLTVFAREIVPFDENVNPNTIELNGYVCKPAMYRTTPFKREICDMLIAVNRAYNKSDYIPCISWGRNARFAKNLQVGERVSIEGRIQSREYQKVLENGDVVIKTAYEVSVSRIIV